MLVGNGLRRYVAARMCALGTRLWRCAIPSRATLPRGEGDVVAASLKIHAAGLVAAQTNIRNRARYVLSQGERDAKSRFDQVRAGVKTNFFVGAERLGSKNSAVP